MMNKQDAQREVQRLFAEARLVLDKAEALMNEHRFGASFLGKTFCPADLSSAEVSGDGDFRAPTWAEPGSGGFWMSSSDMC